jgi:type VI secretion system protein ImpF
MQAFRSAFRERDSAKSLDIRTDSEERVIAGRRSSPRNAISEAVLREELSNDLASLLNTVNLDSIQSLDGLEDVRKSILNFGIADLTAISSDESAVEKIGDWLRDVLERYEPRLIRGSLIVSKDAEIDEESGRVRFHINAEMHSNPVDTPIEFIADIETNSGKMRLSHR